MSEAPDPLLDALRRWSDQRRAARETTNRPAYVRNEGADRRLGRWQNANPRTPDATFVPGGLPSLGKRR